MGREELAEEREVLESIFPDELTVLDDTHIRVAVALEPEGNNPDEDEKPIIILDVRFPDDYPNVAPGLELAHPHDATKPAYLDLSEDKAQLLDSLETTVQESLGMAMVFTLVTALKEAAEQLIQERQGAVEQAREAEMRAEEEKENAKFHGEKVTRERFLAWRDAFRKEQEEDARRRIEEAEAAAKKGNKAAAPMVTEKLTGRQLWERGMVGKLEEDDEEDNSDGSVTLVERSVENLNLDK